MKFKQMALLTLFFMFFALLAVSLTLLIRSTSSLPSWHPVQVLTSTPPPSATPGWWEVTPTLTPTP